MRIKKGDQVKIISGKDKGKAGNVLKVFLSTGKVAVDGLNLYKKRVRPKQRGQKGETVMVVRPMATSNVLLVCGKCKKSTRVGFRIDGNKKVRYCRKCNSDT